MPVQREPKQKKYTSPTGQTYKVPAQLRKYPPPNYVPVVGKTGKPLMPCHPQRARELMEKGKAKPRWMMNSIFYIQLTEREDGVTDPNVVIGIDPGSKFEGYSIRSTKRTFLNIQSSTPDHVKRRIEAKRDRRRARRFRNTPCRKNRCGRAGLTKPDRLPPSTRARCQARLNMVKKLMTIYPITKIVIEDIKARSKKNESQEGGPSNKRWNTTFSPLQIGKRWLYSELQKLVKEPILKISGHATHDHRIALKTVAKTTSKGVQVFEAHCLDAWVLAGLALPHTALEEPDNMSLYVIDAIDLHRRELHATQPAKQGVRRPCGGTMSLGFKRGSLVRHPKYGLTYVGGTSDHGSGPRISLHSIRDGTRLTQHARPEHCQFLAYNTSRVRYIQRAECVCKVCGNIKPVPQVLLTSIRGRGSAEDASLAPACSPSCYDSWIHRQGVRGTPFHRLVANA